MSSAESPQPSTAASVGVATPSAEVPATEQVAWPGLALTAVVGLITAGTAIVSLYIAVQAKRQADRADARELRGALREQAAFSAALVTARIVSITANQSQTVQQYRVEVDSAAPQVTVELIEFLRSDGSVDFVSESPRPLRSFIGQAPDFVLDAEWPQPPFPSWRNERQFFQVVFRDPRGDVWRLHMPSRNLTLLNPRRIREQR